MLHRLPAPFGLIAPLALWASCSCNSGNVVTGDGAAETSCPQASRCGAACCTGDELCYATGGICLKPNGSCAAGQACAEDSRCIDGRCVGWSQFPNIPFDDTCTREFKAGIPRPALQCAWENDPEKATSPSYHAVRHTPLVIDLKLGNADKQLGPSIAVIANATYTEGGARVCQSSGTLFVLDGRTCKKLYALPEPVLATVTPAAADINGDGRAELIAAAPDGGLLAFAYDTSKNAFLKAWRSTDGAGQPSTLGGDACLWGGITVADLDGGAPEILFHGAAHDSAGKVIAQIPGYQFIPWGNPMVVADADLDGEPEVLEGYGTYKYSKASGFTSIAGWVGAGGPGFVAVADFGDFPGAAGDAPKRPEVVVVNSTVRVQTILGQVVFSAAGGLGTGGPPTVADFDGDGKAEIGVAFGDQYIVCDLACKGAPAGCAGDGILWTSPSQDKSSAKTGSSVFDFNGDGRAEVVYGDECFVRVYDGPTGQVIFSQGRFSSTWQENAVVADVDGDAAAEIVLSASATCSTPYCAEYDGSFAGLPCKVKEDCPGGACEAGYCRCTSDKECGGSFSCTAPHPATPGSGNVCRTKHEGCQPGIRVYRDARDHWAGSRRIWNQHAYHVTNVEADGVVLSKDKVQRNWQTAGLNNFRQNVQGNVGPLPSADLTVKEVAVSCGGPKTTLSAKVCNRGGAGADAGVAVSFVDAAGATLCAATTVGFLDPGQCETVSCAAQLDAKTSVQAMVNAGGTVGECRVDNNSSFPAAASCVQ